ncbi:aldehyde dehydrogenase family protein [Microbacterium betulae]|uniref:Aldehyde dehydrogenase family protein n=1 Tax=Microbacterium betulae TaxID=2981139 RepID=A0AA97FHN3_9MICO|nr:aldehyde dehydrogenase family protein [Microbacterium sp. AB]WOF23378.1 aldehyde dehydrogenase family protein [Microbacterium sp. AB]
MSASTRDVAPPALDAAGTGGIPGGGYLDGRWLTDDLALEVVDPEDGSVVGRVRLAGPADVDAAVGGVSRSLREDAWELWERRETLERAAALVREEHERLAAILSAESSKTITEALREVARTAETLRLSAAAAPLLEGETLPFADTARGAGRIGWNRREPLGVVAAITPFNDPMNLVAHKVGPALIAGNAVVLKPAQKTPLSALALLDLLLRAGMPPRRMAALVSDREAGTALVRDRRVDAVSFTGGPATGDLIAATAGARKTLMELGGNNAVIVCEDGDVSAAAAGIVDGAFGVAGQNCLSVQRVLAHAAVYDELVALVSEGARGLVVGTKRSPSTDVGPLISRREADRVQSWIREAEAQGARIVAGGGLHGAFHEPTVLVDVPAGARVLEEEVFGPVVSILPFTELDDAIARADATDYGLQAGVFTASVTVAMHAAARLRVGTVLVNETSDFRIDAMPFGGSRRSGVGREGVASAVLELSAPKNVILNRL